MITSADFAVIMPELVLVGGAILILLLDAFWSSFVKNLGVVVTAAIIFVALITLLMADPNAPLAFGVLSSDPLSGFIGFIVLLSAFLVVMLSWGHLEERKLQPSEYLVGLLICTAGMILMSRSTHLIMIFVALEILSICLYMMIGYDRTNPDSAEAALKYFLLGSFASAIFIFGAVLIYGQTGTMSLDGPLPAYRYRFGLVGVVMLVVGLGFKISIAPFHLWTPDVYQGAPAPVAAFLSSASKAVALAVVIRLFVPGLGIWPDQWNVIWPWLAVVTMFLGNIVALVQEDLKRILAYSSIAHVGFILVALSAGGGVGASAVLFYVMTYSFATIGTFGVIAAMPGDENGRVDLHYVRGLGKSHPWLAAAMTLFVLSLAGVPPLVGFTGKLVAFRAALVAEMYPLVIFAALNAAMAVYYYLRIIIRMYMEPRAEPLTFRVPQMIYPSLGVAGLGVVLMGLFPGGALEWAARSARALLAGAGSMVGM